MLKVIFLGSLLVALTAALNLPSEPKFPSTVCEELKAELSQSGGKLPDADESKPDTKRLQDALTKCTSKGAVKLVKGTGNAFLSGPVKLGTGSELWVDKDVTLFASRNPRDYDKTSGSCGVLGSSSSGCNPLIHVSSASKSGIYGEGTIDGRGGAKMTGSSESWWDLAVKAQNESKDENCPRLVIVEGGSDFTMYKIRLHNSPNFHVTTDGLSGLVVWGCRVQTPTSTYSGAHARNTDAFDPNGHNLVFYQNYIDTGDDNIAIKGGKSQVQNVLIQDNHFYRGHGMSIGSETNAGVVNVTVKTLTIDGADNGLRIKSDASKGGTVSGVTYEDICIRNVDEPLVFDSYYSDSKGSAYPNFHDIHIKDTHIISSGKKKIVFRGYDSSHALKISLDNVQSDVDLSSVTASDAEITEGPGAVTNIGLKADSSKNVKISGTPGKSTPHSCSFPAYSP